MATRNIWGARRAQLWCLEGEIPQPITAAGQAAHQRGEFRRRNGRERPLDFRERRRNGRERPLDFRERRRNGRERPLDFRERRRNGRERPLDFRERRRNYRERRAIALPGCVDEAR